MTLESVFLSTYYSNGHIFASVCSLSQSPFMLFPNIHSFDHKRFKAVYTGNSVNLTDEMIYLQFSHFAHSLNPEIPFYIVKKYFLHSKQPVIEQRRMISNGEDQGLKALSLMESYLMTATWLWEVMVE